MLDMDAPPLCRRLSVPVLLAPSVCEVDVRLCLRGRVASPGPGKGGSGRSSSSSCRLCRGETGSTAVGPETEPALLMSVAPASPAATAVDVAVEDSASAAVDGSGSVSSSRPSDLPLVSFRSRRGLVTDDDPGDRRTLSLPLAPLADGDGLMLMLKVDAEASALPVTEEDRSPSNDRLGSVPTRLRLPRPGMLSSCCSGCSDSAFALPSLLSYADNNVIRAMYASCWGRQLSSASATHDAAQCPSLVVVLRSLAFS